MADNLDPTVDNQDQGTTVNAGSNVATITQAQPEQFSWKSGLGPDLSKAPSLGKFEDSKAGLAEVAKSYVNLEKLLGHEKIPLPKGPDDIEGRAAFNRAIGVPTAPELYNLPDANLPGGLDASLSDKMSFQQIAHKHGLTPGQALGLWQDYAKLTNEAHGKMSKEFSDQIDQNINALRKEWGDAYGANVELANMAISKLAEDQSMGDWLTANIAKHPYGLKWAAKIGNMLAENKIGEFQYKRFSMTPQEAQNEVSRIKNDPNHPYNSEKATEQDHSAAVDHVNRLIAIALGKS